MELAVMNNGRSLCIDLLGKKSITLTKTDARLIAFHLTANHSSTTQQSDYKDFCAYLASRTKGRNKTASRAKKAVCNPKPQK